jgi:hypothetical protein
MGERGSPAYMCPALGLGRAPLSKASDVYSCGVLVWEVLSGVPLWSRGEAAGVASAAQLYGAVAEGARPGGGAELTGLAPRGVGDWMAAMWHPHPRMRPPLEDVAEALRVLCGGVERLPWRGDAGWAESFGVSAAAGARTSLAAGLVAPAVGAAAVSPAPAAPVPEPVAAAAPPTTVPPAAAPPTTVPPAAAPPAPPPPAAAAGAPEAAAVAAADEEDVPPPANPDAGDADDDMPPANPDSA